MNAVVKHSWPKVSYTQTQLGAGTTATGQALPGGLDLTTPALRLQPGALRDCLNFECGQFGGYARIQGYERVDGRTAPSTATYTIVQLDAFASIPMVGEVITQVGSGATGVIIAVVPGPPPYLVVTRVTGIFDDSHVVATPGGSGSLDLFIPLLWGF